MWRSPLAYKWSKMRVAVIYTCSCDVAMRICIHLKQVFLSLFLGQRVRVITLINLSFPQLLRSMDTYHYHHHNWCPLLDMPCPLKAMPIQCNGFAIITNTGQRKLKGLGLPVDYPNPYGFKFSSIYSWDYVYLIYLHSSFRRFRIWFQKVFVFLWVYLQKYISRNQNIT